MYASTTPTSPGLKATSPTDRRTEGRERLYDGPLRTILSTLDIRLYLPDLENFPGIDVETICRLCHPGSRYARRVPCYDANCQEQCGLLNDGNFERGFLCGSRPQRQQISRFDGYNPAILVYIVQYHVLSSIVFSPHSITYRIQMQPCDDRMPYGVVGCEWKRSFTSRINFRFIALVSSLRNVHLVQVRP